MTDHERKPGERRSTDESLRTERRRTDSHLAGTLGALGDAGDDLIAKARDKADSVLKDARDRQDERLVSDGRLEDAADDVEQQRASIAPKGGRVIVRVESRAEEVWVTVSDSGEGIPADQLTSIFDRFFQTNKHDRRGLGLGLFIVKSIVQAHSGRVWAESTPGRGSRFVFTLPRRHGNGE
jgi:signal transduction histidine kinase